MADILDIFCCLRLENPWCFGKCSCLHLQAERDGGEPIVMRRGVISLFILVAESWKEMWIFSKICSDADNASFPLLLDLWVYRKWKSFIRHPLSFVWGIGIILSLMQMQKKWLQSALIWWCGLENVCTPTS